MKTQPYTYARSVPLHPLVRRFVRWSWFGCFFGEYEWYRRLYGGKWMQTHVDGPVHGCMWLNVPDWATPSYRELPWRGTPQFVDYDAPNDKAEAPQVASSRSMKSRPSNL